MMKYYCCVICGSPNSSIFTTHWHAYRNVYLPHLVGDNLIRKLVCECYVSSEVAVMHITFRSVVDINDLFRV